MDIQVKPEDYSKIRPFFKPVMFDMFVTAVLKNEMSGRVYVDSLDNPRSGFIMTPESCLAVGDAENRLFLQNLRQIFEETVLVGDVVNPANNEFCIGFVSGDWDTVLPQLMNGWQQLTDENGDTCHYLLKKLTFDWRNHLPIGYTVQQVNNSKLHTQAMALLARAFDMAQLNTSHDFAKFSQTGFGFVTLSGDEVVCASMSDVVSGNRCEIGIATAEKHRRLGLAAVTTAASVEHALAIGMSEVNWQTGDDHWGSRKTAEKVGFKLNLLFPCRFFEPQKG